MVLSRAKEMLRLFIMHAGSCLDPNPDADVEAEPRYCKSCYSMMLRCALTTAIYHGNLHARRLQLVSVSSSSSAYQWRW